MAKKSTPKKRGAAKKKAAPKKTATKKVVKKKTETEKPVAKKSVPETTNEPTEEKVKNKISAKKKTKPKRASAANKASSDAAINTSGIVKSASKKSNPRSRRSSLVSFTMEDVMEILEQNRNEIKKITAPVVKKKAAIAKVAAVVKPQNLGAASLADILGLSASSSGKASSANKTVPKKWAKYHKMLTDLYEKLNREHTARSQETLKKSSKEDSGELSSISSDAGTDNSFRDLALSLVSSEQEALSEINAALDRIYRGTYGICEHTGDPISEERLAAIPFTRFSLEGQKQYELFRRRSSYQGGMFTKTAEDAAEFVVEEGE